MTVNVRVPLSAVEETITLLQNYLAGGGVDLDGDKLQIMWQALLEADQITIVKDDVYRQLRDIQE